MKLTKSLVQIILLLFYMCCFGMITVRAKFPDETEAYYEGWMF